MCLGAQAKAANEQAKRNYQYQLQKREGEWMHQLSLSGVERIQYEQGINASNLQLAEIYGDIQDKQGQLVDEAMLADQEKWKEFLQNNTGARLAASGVTGKSAQRIAALDLAQYLTESAQRGRKVSNDAKELQREGRKAAGAAAAQQKQMWANQAFVKMPDIAPPQPVMRNVAAEAFMEGLQIATSAVSAGASVAAAGSSKKLKDNIVKIGKSIAGHNIYKFNYKGDSRRYVGVIAEEIQQTVPEAVVTMPNGFLGVIYDLIDVQFKEVV